MSNLDTLNYFKGALPRSNNDLQTQLHQDSNGVDKIKEYWFYLNELEIKTSEETLIKEFCTQGKILDFYFKKENSTNPNYYSTAKIKLSQLNLPTQEITNELSRRLRCRITLNEIFSENNSRDKLVKNSDMPKRSNKIKRHICDRREKKSKWDQKPILEAKSKSRSRSIDHKGNNNLKQHYSRSRSRSRSRSSSQRYFLANRKNRENETSYNREDIEKKIDFRYRNNVNSNSTRNNQSNSNYYSKSNMSEGIREIWIGILPKNISKQILFNDFFIYGEIENIDLNTEKV